MICRSCEHNLPETSFYWAVRDVRRQTICTECVKTASHSIGKKVRLRNANWYNQYKSTIKCSQCPENHIAALDFHHKDSATKLATIANFVRSNCSLKTLKAEIDKCIVLCANCHRKLHYKVPDRDYLDPDRAISD